ncbi:MAG: 2-dehydro-3-deoxygalactonokinase [Steroidobacteraceae bacterium]
MSARDEEHQPRTARVLCDWGSSRLRAFLLIDGVVAERRDGPGIGALGAEAPAEALARVLAPWRARRTLERTVLCGMAGSRNGLVEVPYVRAPATLGQWRAGAVTLRAGADPLTVLPGIQAQNFRDVADVMRGEETQIFGALALEPALAAGRRMLVLPGTHCKWVEVRDGRIARLQTYFTGELFELLSTRSSLLRVGGADEPDEEGFEVGLRNAARFDLAANLFETRSAQLIEGRSAGWARCLLSGLLIGAEVHSMRAHLQASGSVPTLIGDPALTARYARALERFGVEARVLDGDHCVLAGLGAAVAGLAQS